MIKEVRKTLQCKRGIGKNHRGLSMKMNINIMAGDTETVNGLPHTIQLYNGKDLYFEYVNKDNILDKFLDYIEKTCKYNQINVCYFHNLEFDLMIIFKKFLKEIYRQGNKCAFTYRGWNFGVFTNKVNFIVMRKKVYESDNDDKKIAKYIKVQILDSMAFTQMGLDKSLKAFGLEDNKLSQPKNLGSKYIKTKEFEDYAKNDVKILWNLAMKIYDLHKFFNAQISVSIAQFSMRVFRHNYLKEKQVIEYPPDECVEFSERSYHGGLNYSYKEPKIFENCIDVDINSSYPYACLFLPNMTNGFYQKVNKFDKNHCGVYLCDGYIKSKYPILFNDEFKQIQGKFENMCFTNWDINTAYKYADDFDLKIKKGYVFITINEETNPFIKFINDIYQKRLEAKKTGNKAMDTIYKYILNSFYGKFIQANELQKYNEKNEKPCESDLEKLKELKELTKELGIDINYYYDKHLDKFIMKEKSYEAGIYYNPFIATLITSNARARLIDLMYKYKAIHCSTDSIKTTMDIPDSDCSNKLGGIKKEVKGKCFIFRNKLYLHYAENFNNCKHKEGDKDLYIDSNQHLCKYALHGYRGDLDTLVKNRYNLLKDKKMNYTYKKVIKIREGFKQGLEAGLFLEKKEVLNLDKEDK